MIHCDSFFKGFSDKTARSLENYNELSLEDKQIEQNSIISSIINDSNEFSYEADDDDDGGSFEEAAEESSNDQNSNNANDISSDDEMPSDDDMSMDEGSDDDDMSMDDDMGGDMDSEGNGDDSSDGGDGDDSKDGLDDLDQNKGSSLNPYTQINQKLFFIDKLNELYDSINSTIDQYNTLYSDRYELDQLRDLSNIVDGERNAFMMQQNPENYIKLRLYHKRYEEIVQKFIDENNKNKHD